MKVSLTPKEDDNILMENSMYTEATVLFAVDSQFIFSTGRGDGVERYSVQIQVRIYMQLTQVSKSAFDNK